MYFDGELQVLEAIADTTENLYFVLATDGTYFIYVSFTYLFDSVFDFTTFTFKTVLTLTVADKQQFSMSGTEFYGLSIFTDSFVYLSLCEKEETTGGNLIAKFSIATGSPLFDSQTILYPDPY